MNKIFVISLCLLSFFAVASDVLGHGAAGGQDKIVNGYLIDFGYDPEAPTAGEQSRFTFALLDSETQGVVPFESAFVRIAKGDNVLFAATLERTIADNVSMAYNFTEGGTYDLAVRFEKYGADAPQLRIPEIVAETTFVLDIAGSEALPAGESRAGQYLILGFLSGAVIGGMAMYFVRGRTKKTLQQ